MQGSEAPPSLAKRLLKPKDPPRCWLTTALAQLGARGLFMFSWGYVCFSADGLFITGLLGRGPWLDLGVYFAITFLRPILLGYAALNKRSLLSEAWFDFAWQCLTVGVDSAFIGRLFRQIPSDADFRNASITSPFDQMLLILFSLALTLLLFDMLASSVLALIVLVAASGHAPVPKGVWRLNLPDLLREEHGPIAPEYVFAHFRSDVLWACRTFFETHTVFRRNSAIEPGWFATLRGTVALVALVTIFVFGSVNTVINPGQQFRYPLPRRGVPFPTPYDSGFPDVLYGVIFFKRLASLPEAYRSDPFSAYSREVGDILSQFHVNATAGSTQFPCNFQPAARWNATPPSPTVNLGVTWSCSGLRGATVGQPVTGSVVSPVVRLAWTGNMGVDPILQGYVASVPIWNRSRPWMESFGPYLAWNVSVGTNMKLTVGMSMYYARPGTMLDVIGFKRKAVEILGFPPVSAISSSAEQPSQTTIEINPFTGTSYEGRFTAWEEYVVYTVLVGLVTTGGLYSSFDVFFTLLFGQSLVNLSLGIKPIAPFGVIMRMDRGTLRNRLLSGYPGLESTIGCERTEAICKFLCDFVLDTGPVDPNCSPARQGTQILGARDSPPSEGESKQDLVVVSSKLV